MEREERVFKSFCDRIVHMGLQEEDEELVQQAFKKSVVMHQEFLGN